MYFPFLRGKQWELQAVLESKQLIINSGRIIPVIEPLNFRASANAVSNLIQGGARLIIIINPQVGNLSGSGIDLYKPFLDSIENKDLITLGYFITENTSLVDLQFAINEFSDFSFALIHNTNSGLKNELLNIDSVSYHMFMDGRVSAGYQAAFINTRRVLIRDCFISQPRNVDYCGDEYFSDLFSTFSPNYYGFGDYQIVGSKFSRGGPAHAVALHLTYLKEPYGGEIWVRHFISDDTETSSNVQGKYFQALNKLVKFLNQYKNTPNTAGATEYRQNLAEGRFHGLGYPKKVSIKHHFELISQLL